MPATAGLVQSNREPKNSLAGTFFSSLVHISDVLMEEQRLECGIIASEVLGALGGFSGGS
jgi:hypothetical protein